MANTSHLEILHSGVDAWNHWRRTLKPQYPDLRGADLSGLDLSGYDFALANMVDADLSKTRMYHGAFEYAQLKRTVFRGAYLHGVSMTVTSFDDVDFSGAGLHHVDFSLSKFNNVSFDDASLTGPRFDECTLHGGSMRRASLVHVVFADTLIEAMDFAGASIHSARFANTKFVDVKGLADVCHEGPSSIGLDTFFLNGGLPESFMRGAGLPEEFIAYATALAGHPIELYSCFISYATPDEIFARRLHADLQARNVRAWFAPEDLKIGDRFRTRIDESIRHHDKLVLVLSRAAIGSPWVESEVETAFARERRERRDVLFPVRLDDDVFDTDRAWAANIVNTRQIGDFRDWKDHDNYVKAFTRLLRDLKKDAKIVMR